MPNWQPNWRDVEWDHRAADEAIQSLRQAATFVEETAAQRRQRAAEATAEWRGRFREEFDGHLSRALRRAAELAGELRAKADEISRADERARAEQKHREHERDRWRREKREEDERARLLSLGLLP